MLLQLQGRVSRALIPSIAVSIALLGGCQNGPPAELLRADGDRAMERGEYIEAAGHYEQIARRYPGDWQAQYKLGLAELENGNLLKARRALEIALTRKPQNPDIADAFAEVLFRQQSHDELFAFLRERTQQTQSVRAYQRLADYAMRSSDPDSAKVAIETAIAIDDGRTVEPYLAAASMHEQLGNLDRAVHRLRQAYWIDPKDARVSKRLRALGEIPGPTLALPPDQDVAIGG